MLWVQSGVVDQRIHFQVPLGATPNAVWRKRGTGAWTQMTTPTLTEDDPTNAPDVWSLLMDEDMTIATGKTTEEMVFRITGDGMSAQVEKVMLYDALEADAVKLNGSTLLGAGTSADKWRG